MAEILWTPPLDGSTRIERYMAALGFEEYQALWEWSVQDLEGFWASVWETFDVRASVPYATVLSSHAMPGAQFFDGACLSYAEHALARRGSEPAVIGISEARPRTTLSFDELADGVARVRTGLRRLGVGPGDRVAAYLPNIPETVVAFLATASLGAIWTSCAPELGARAVVERFAQVEPVVLFAVDGYRYGGKPVERRGQLRAIVDGLPSLRHLVALPYLDPAWAGDLGAGPGTGAPPGRRSAGTGPQTIGFSDLAADDPDRLEHTQVSFRHPLYILYSSGTTGPPKAIVHGHGGILVEHLKLLGLHADLGPGDRFTWFTTTGWMMWNVLVSGLLVGSTLVLYDGSPGFPSLDMLWSLCESERMSFFGTSAPFIHRCAKDGLSPGADHDLSTLRTVGSTGAPLSADGFRWVSRAVGGDVPVSSMSGGTDVCTAFVGGCPVVPVRAGEISCRYLGAAVSADHGELVVTEPMPSMPLGLWGDDDGSRYAATYFSQRPGTWTHGDWLEETDTGGLIITGRSDATLNRGGVRIGTAEVYRVVEAVPGVADSLVVHMEDQDCLVLLVVAEPGPEDAHSSPVGSEDRATTSLIEQVTTALRTELSPRHVPDEVHLVDAVPTTLSGKKLEVPTKRILGGAAPDGVASRGALRDPAALDAVARLAAQRRGGRSLSGERRP